MSKKLLQVIIVVFVLCSAVSVFASDIRTLHQNKIDDSSDTWHQDAALCVDGLKVFRTIAYQKGGGAAVSNIQLYEEKDGKVVPARCE